MSEFMLAGSDPRLLLSHVALAGLGAILEGAGARALLGWSGGMASKPVLDVDGWSANEIGAAVRAHAQRATHGWPAETLTDAKGRARGLMSPRLASLAMPDGWRALEDGRRRVADTASELDLRLLGALGRPAYWRARDRRPAQDEGASRWEMQPRTRARSSSAPACCRSPVPSPPAPTRR